MAEDDVRVVFGGEPAGAVAAMAKVEAELRRLGFTGKELATGMEEAGKIITKAFSAEAPNRMRGQIEQTSIATNFLNSAMLKLGAAIGAAFTVSKIVSTVEQLGKASDEAQRLAATLGLTVENASRFSNLMAGLGAEGAPQVLEKLSTAMAKVMTNPGGAQGHAFKSLGISLDTVKDNLNNAEGMLNVLREAFNKYADGANKTAAMTAIMGMGFQKLVPYLTKSKDELDELADRVARTGSTIHAGLSARLEETSQNTNILKLSLTGLGLAAYNSMGPAFDAIVLKLTDLVQWLTKLTNDSKGVWANFADGVNLVLKACTMLGDILSPLFSSMEGQGSPALQAIVLLFNAWATVNYVVVASIQTLIDTVKFIIGHVTAFFNLLGALLLPTMREVGSAANTTKDGLQSLSDLVSGTIIAGFQGLWDILKSVAEYVVKCLAEFVRLGAGLVDLVDKIVPVKQAFNEVVTVVGSWVSGVMAAIEKMLASLQYLYQRIKRFFSETLEEKKAAFEAHSKAIEEINDRYLSRMAASWSGFGATVARMLANVRASAAAAVPSGGQGYGGTEPPMGSVKPDAGPPKAGGGGGGKDIKNYMQEWREALIKMEIEQGLFFSTSKAMELAYWTDKLNWVRTNQSQIIAEYMKAGDTKLQAEQRYKALEFAALQTHFGLMKSEANRELADYRSNLSTQLADLKANLADKLITETEWFEQSVALQRQYMAKLKALGLEGTQQFQEAERQMLGIVREHSKNMQTEWASMFGWFNNKLDAMVTGILMGTQTWRQAMRRAFADMATAFIVEVAKMTLRWLVFKGLTAIGAVGMARSVGNPFAQLAGSIGTMVGGGGGGGGNAGNRALTSATTALTAATTLNSLATKSNSTGLLGMAMQAITWIAGQLGLTAAVTSDTSATMIQVAEEITLIGAITALTSAVTALTIVMAMEAAIPFATGAWKLPHDMPATVHAGEMIIPAKEAEMIRTGQGGVQMLAAMFGKSSMLRQMQGTMSDVASTGDLGAMAAAAADSGSSGGGGIAGVMSALKGGGGGSQAVQVSFSVSAIDAASVHSFFQKHSGSIATAVASEVRNANSAMSKAGRMASSSG